MLNFLRCAVLKIEEGGSTWDQEWRTFNHTFGTDFSLIVFMELAYSSATAQHDIVFLRDLGGVESESGMEEVVLEVVEIESGC